jgi:hypothetical protein
MRQSSRLLAADGFTCIVTSALVSQLPARSAREPDHYGLGAMWRVADLASSRRRPSRRHTFKPLSCPETEGSFHRSCLRSFVRRAAAFCARAYVASPIRCPPWLHCYSKWFTHRSAHTHAAFGPFSKQARSFGSAVERLITDLLVATAGLLNCLSHGSLFHAFYQVWMGKGNGR